jgi:hypothetical protein
MEIEVEIPSSDEEPVIKKPQVARRNHSMCNRQ